MDTVEFSPLRPLDDFILQSARFQLPNMKELDRWANRVSSNLLYYQTNYFILALIIFIIVGVLHPVQMVLGFIAIVMAFCGFVSVSKHQMQVRRFKRNHPGLSVVAIVVVGYLLISFFGSVIVFMFGVALPLFVVLLHASLRLRNIKNKIASKVEYVGIHRTPMGLILESLGMEQEAAS